ncbi:hypothetical protein H2200_006886 [Cladophialophora chaetospira]|uniref:Leucine Rich Repeat domain protein n=1 Tax=Cladophialophora chaetospira TaxID=386627 RepID=A0AA38X970_9EURO|nr:hypothetical protein H2200_006886 [Cladophialophora chaetospira]
MDEPELPPLSQSDPASFQARPRPSFLLTRKRTLSDYGNEPATSSDPATFSSDETAPGAENYATGKRKKHTYRGSWWDRHPAKNGTRTSQRKKREFKRNFDSGIFMGSESEEPLSSDSFNMEEDFLRDQDNEIEQTRPSKLWSSDRLDTTPRAKLPLRAVDQLPRKHEAVCQIIKQCLELGKEDVDLSAMSLSSLPTEVTTLNTLSKQDEIVPGMLHIGTDLEPRLRIFLANNLFTKVPNPVLGLRNLRFLSLRNNNLHSIPPGIRDLVNLESLNVAGNQLTELPFEILHLVSNCRLQELIIQPNPWRQLPRLPMERIRPDTILRMQNGSLRLWQAPGMSGHATKCPRRPLQASSLPSLTELVLRQLSKIDTRGETDFCDYMPSGSPQTVLDHLEFVREHPNRQCSSCMRVLVLAAKEEIEWWYISSIGRTDGTTAQSVPDSLAAVPFRRMLCSPVCQARKDRSSGQDVE